MKLKNLFVLFVAVVCVKISHAQQTEHFFQYPVPPDNLETLTDRTNYLVEHFWDRCNLKSAFSARQKMAEAFSDYVSFMPYADSVVVINSIEKLIKEVKKKPEHLLLLTQMAENNLYCDTAEYIIDSAYLPFARAAASTGGIPRDQRDRYALQSSQLEGSQVGMKSPSFTMIQPNGELTSIDDIENRYILVLFDDPNDSENLLTRVRLSADYSINELIKRGYVAVVSLYPGVADEAWKTRAAGYPSNWIVGASPDANRLFDQRQKPTIYYLNRDKQILSKNLYIDNLIEAFRVVLVNQDRINQERERLKKEALQQRETRDAEEK